MEKDHKVTFAAYKVWAVSHEPTNPDGIIFLQKVNSTDSTVTVANVPKICSLNEGQRVMAKNDANGLLAGIMGIACMHCDFNLLRKKKACELSKRYPFKKAKSHNSLRPKNK